MREEEDPGGAVASTGVLDHSLAGEGPTDKPSTGTRQLRSRLLQRVALPEIDLVPISPDVDLRNFSYLPLYVARLRDSRMIGEVTGEEFMAAVLLWCAAWHQVPSGSLPDDDRQLAKLAGFGRDLKTWMKVRDGALYGFVRCLADGRLYHPVLVEEAQDAWEKKRIQSKKGKAGSDARWKKPRPDPDGTGINSDGTGNASANENDGKREGIEGKGIEKKGTEGKGSEDSFRLRGARWPDGAVVSQEWKDEASAKRADHGLPDINIDLEAEKFANYWAAKAGAGATKANWKKTWINWALRTEAKNHGIRQGKPSPHAQLVESVPRVLEKLRQRREHGDG